MLARTGSAEKPLRKRRFTSNVVAPLTFAADVICLAIAVPAAISLHQLLIGGFLELRAHLGPLLIAVVGFVLIRLSRDAYGGPTGVREADHAVVADFLIAIMLSVAAIWQLELLGEYSRGLIGFYVLVAAGLLYLSRFGVRGLVQRWTAAGYIGQRVVLYGGDPDTLERVGRLLLLEELPHLTVVGIADERQTRVAASGHGNMPFIGDLSAVVSLAQQGGIDQVLIGLPDITQARLDGIVQRLSEVSVDVSLIPREVLTLTSKHKVHLIGAMPIFTLWQRPIRDIDGLLKAAEDKVLAGLGLVLLSPLLALTTVAIKLTSSGPVLFKQKRFGINNTEFEVVKFRSMYVDRQDPSGAQRTRAGDDRVTPVGRIIRRLSIDELPQLWNVLRGDMSIVGPRPHATEMKVGDQYYFDAVAGYAARHRVKPGLTGLAQVRGLRGEIATVERARMRVDFDRYYIDNWSLMLDLRIIGETVVRLLFDRHAY